MLAQLFESDAARRQLVAPGCVDVTIEEVFAETQPGGEVEDDFEVGSGLADPLDKRSAELDE